VAEAYDDPNVPPLNPNDPFFGYTVYPNPAYTDPSLHTITNYTDYFATNTVLDFSDRECRKTLTLYITNDDIVEFNEDIVMWLEYIDGQTYFPNPWMDQATLTIMYHDQPAGAVDREWNPDNIPETNPSFNKIPGANNVGYAVAAQPYQKT